MSRFPSITLACPRLCARPALLAIGLGILLLLPIQGAFGQAAPACAERLEQAREHYEARRYDEAIGQLSTCLWRDDLSIRYAEQAYRLMALAYLRMDDVGSARLAIVRLLDHSPSYEADPVEDLPSYVSLVRLVRQQVLPPAPDTTATATADSVRDVPPTDVAVLADDDHPLARRLSIALRVGMNNYHGERSSDAGGASELTTAAGPGAEARLSYHFTRFFDLGLYYQVGRYPALLDYKGRKYPLIDRTESSDWLHMTGLLAHVSLLPESRVSPTAHLGLNTTFGLIDGTIRVGVGPRFGTGVDVRLHPHVVASLSASGIIVVPDRAADVASTSSSISDLFSLVTLGVRYRLGPTR